MDNPRIELMLEVPAQRVMHNLQVENQRIEKQVQKGVQMAIDELSQKDYLAELIKEKIVTKISGDFASTVWRYDIRDRLTKKFESEITKEVDQYIEQLTKQIAKSISETDE